MQQGVEAGLCRFKCEFCGVSASDNIVVDVAIHARGIASAALVDKQDVAIAPYVLERAPVGRIKLRGALTRAAGKGDERVGLRRQIQCGHDSDGNLDFCGVRIGRIFGPP